MSYNAKRNTKPINILELKIKKNPKYGYISSVVDTGCSMSKYTKDMDYVRKNFRVRPNEIFKRMKITTFVQMLLQIESVNIALSKTQSEDVPDSFPSENGHKSLDNHRSTLLTVISGFGELDDKSEKPQSGNNSKEEDKIVDESSSPYLLLDLRDRENYNKEHIRTAISYPMTMLSRMLNYEIKEMLAYKAKEGKIIVIYDWDEKNIHQAASTLVERGYKNLLVLSGGLKIAKEHFGSSLITEDPLNNSFTEQNVDLLQKTLDHILNDSNKYGNYLHSLSSSFNVFYGQCPQSQIYSRHVLCQVDYSKSKLHHQTPQRTFPHLNY